MVSSSSTELNNNRILLFCNQEKKKTHFSVFDSFASIRPGIIESPTINGVPGFQSYISVLLSGLLVLFDTPNSAVNSSDGVFENSTDMQEIYSFFSTCMTMLSISMEVILDNASLLELVL